jgi:cytochrome c-type biogenesis protein CcmH
MTRFALLGTLVLALVCAGTAAASESHPTLAELEKEIICPTCHTTLELSNAPIADRIRAFIRARIAAGDTKSEIKSKLVAQFGESVLAAPPKKGFNLLAWGLPLAGILIAALSVGLLARRWSRVRPEPVGGASSVNGRGPLDPELERRLDEELARFDS